MTTFHELLGLRPGDSAQLDKYVSEREVFKSKMAVLIRNDEQINIEAYYSMYYMNLSTDHVMSVVSSADIESECIRGVMGISRSSFVERHDLPQDEVHRAKPYGAWLEEVAGFRDAAGDEMPKFYSELFDFIIDRKSVV